MPSVIYRRPAIRVRMFRNLQVPAYSAGSAMFFSLITNLILSIPVQFCMTITALSAFNVMTIRLITFPCVSEFVPPRTLTCSACFRAYYPINRHEFLIIRNEWCAALLYIPSREFLISILAPIKPRCARTECVRSRIFFPYNSTYFFTSINSKLIFSGIL